MRLIRGFRLGIVAIFCAIVTSSFNANAERYKLAQNTNNDFKSTIRETAHAWLNALKNQDAQDLVNHSSFPFVYKSTFVVKECESRASTKGELFRLLKCIKNHDKLLLGELEGRFDSEYTSITGPVNDLNKDIDRPLKRLIGKMRSNEYAIKVELSGDGVFYDLVLIVSWPPEQPWPGVRALLLDASFDAG